MVHGHFVSSWKGEMAGRRLIVRLDVKGENLIKGVHLEGLRVIGAPEDYAVRYYHQGADELIFIDSVASLYGRNHLHPLISKTVKRVFVPLTVGGGIRGIDDATEILRMGADKVAINTAAVANPSLISDIANKFGSQCCVLSIQAKRFGEQRWEVLTEGGRERTGRCVIDWARDAVQLGVGEILLTSVDREGTGAGFDLELTKHLSDAVDVPIIASGGFGKPEHLISLFENTKVDAMASAWALHYDKVTIEELRIEAKKAGFEVR